MIRSFACRDTQRLFEGKATLRFQTIRTTATGKLAMLNHALELRDLLSPPGNHLEALKGTRAERRSKLLTIIEAELPVDGMRAIHPGEILLEEFLKPLNMTSASLAHRLGIDEAEMVQIILEKRDISPGTALRLSKFWGTTPEYWLSLQMSYSLKIAKAELHPDVLNKIVPFPRTI